MNRSFRRKMERLSASRQSLDQTAIQARIAAAAGEVQRLQAMLQHVQAGRALASQIPVVESPADVAPEDDPNFFRTAAIEDFNDREATTRMKLIAAHEEFYLAVEAADPADAAGRIAVPPSIVKP